MQYALELKNVHYAYHTLEGETYALKDITFSVREGEFIALVGPSGCGKSTLLHLIAGLLTPEKGLIKINGSYHPDNTSGIGYMLPVTAVSDICCKRMNFLSGVPSIRTFFSVSRSSMH